ncbi:MAG: dienelactone hydrolase family protein [Proteobacteria bacterium]|nr:dienelactone hydrolase family protein [Pseudomonadota bacterium]
MIEEHVDITISDGLMNTFVTYPEEGGPFPVVFFYMDAPGKREELHDMARRIATVGYFVVLPNLYYRQTRQFDFVRDEAGMEKMFAMMHSLTNKLIVQDTQAMLDFVDQHEHAAAARVGAVGYCMSGPFVLAAAGGHPDRIQCAASIYGANLLNDTPDSAHLFADRVKGELYFACAEIDKYALADVIERLDKHLKQSGVNYRLEWYPGAEHGFAFPERLSVYHKASAERHWERLFALFKRNLADLS